MDGSTALAPLVPTKAEADEALENARRKAAVNLDLLLEQYTTRALANTAPLTAVQAAVELNYKVSGMAAKQGAQQAAGTGFSIKIVLPDGNARSREVVVEQTPNVVEEPDVLASVPAYLSALFVENDDLMTPEGRNV